MLEIFILISLSRNMGALAQQKGLSASRWKRYTVLTWIALEILGFIPAFLFFNGSFLALTLFGYGLATIGYFSLRMNLKKRPDANAMHEWINEIGTDSKEPLPTQN